MGRAWKNLPGWMWGKGAAGMGERSRQVQLVLNDNFLQRGRLMCLLPLAVGTDKQLKVQGCAGEGLHPEAKGFPLACEPAC
jgi:hypothetical protein